MERTFDTHRIRSTVSLNGVWNFRMDGFDKAYQLPVPAVWEQHPDFLSHRGRGTYTRTVTVAADGNVRLSFKGVSHTADVYFDGEHVAHHYNAFTPFSAIVRGVRAGEHEIRVVVENTFGEHSALHRPNDYYTYGGITRPVAMERVNDVYLRFVHVTPYNAGGVWHARISVRVANLASEERTVRLSVELAGKRHSADVTVAAESETDARFDDAFPAAEPWSPQSPVLYTVNAVLSSDGKPIDDLIDRTGFRTVTVQGTRILVNGAPVQFRGFNRHEDYAVDGCAVALQHQMQDLDLLQDMNANAVRTCHYPNDERFLDLCDERGIFVWEENHARGGGLAEMQNPNFDRQCEDCIREMIEAHYNHPAIVIWGILNECASETEQGREKYAAQYAQIRRMDKSRPVTSATCRHFADICLDLPDVVSFNLYTNWYEDDDVAARNDRELAWIKESGGSGKPVIVSELGAAALYGYRDRAACKWSEEYQAALLRETLAVYLHDERLSGVFVWQFADCRVTEEGHWFATRPRCHNNKGVLDEYRRPKLAYDAVKAAFGAAAQGK